MLTEVCNDIRIEPDLQPITEETLRYEHSGTNTQGPTQGPTLMLECSPDQTKAH